MGQKTEQKIGQKTNIVTIPARFDSVVKKIAETARKNGYDVYATGGFVRDLLLWREPKDLDVMVSCASNETVGDTSANSVMTRTISRTTPGIDLAKLVATKYSLEQPTIFEQFGTAQLIIDGELIEFAMPRKESYTDNSRKPATEIGSLRQDAMRRDFTINSLFLLLNNSAMELLDLTGRGIVDIQNRIIRVTDTSRAEEIFTQDPLRILRAVRQNMQLNFDIEPLTKEAMVRTAKTIHKISTERVYEELEKILSGDTPSHAFRMLDEVNLLCEILPEISAIKSDNLFERTLNTLDATAPNNLVLRVSALFSEVANTNVSETALKRLHFSNAFVGSVTTVLSHYRSLNQTLSDADIRRLAFRANDQFDNILSLAKASSSDSIDTINDTINQVDALKAKGELYITKEVLTGEEIMEHFKIPPGKDVAKMKALALEAQFENPHISKDEALRILDAGRKPTLHYMLPR